MSFQQKILEVAPQMNPQVVQLLHAEVSQLWSVLLWGLGACGSGFVVLLTLVLNMRSQVEKELKKDMDAIVETLNEIKNALLGTFHEKGAISKLHDLEQDIKALKETKGDTQ